MSIEIYDRATKKIVKEEQYKEKELKFLYNTTMGRILLKLVYSTRLYSIVNSKFYNTKSSMKMIEPFIEKYKINMNSYEDKKYHSFNDFFIRRFKENVRLFNQDSNGLLSVADSKLLVKKINDNLELNIKNSIYTISSLLKDKYIADDYRNGTCLVFRLTVDDCHRYFHIDNGTVENVKNINGCLHTVGQIANKKVKPYTENHRIINILNTENFGNIVYIEIGAMQVGKIVNHSNKVFRKGYEKGYFEFGGSTIILLFKEKTIKIDEDILENSKQDIETKVKALERIGEKL